MRRALLLLIAAAMALFGFIQVGPDAPSPPDFGTPDTGETDGAEASPTAWYCPWVAAGDVVDSSVAVATDADASVRMTLFDPVTNAEPSEVLFDLVAPTATGVTTGNVLRRGDSPAIVEISDGPASVSSVQWADGFVTADRCVVSVPEEWFLLGGATKTGTFTQLRLFNPFADNAEVEVLAFSEFNLDLIPDLDAIDVAGRSWTTIDLGTYLPFRDQLAFRVRSTSGLVIPMLVRTDERGEAAIPGSGLSETWDFPVVAPGKLDPSIAVLSGGDDGVVVSIDLVTPGGLIANAREITLDQGQPELIPLSDLVEAPYGVHVRATAPIAAAVVATVPTPEDGEGGEEGSGEGAVDTTTTLDTTTTTSVTDTTVVVEEDFIRGLAGTAGIPAPASTWITPLDTLPGSDVTLWIMNTALDPASVAVMPLGEGAGDTGGYEEMSLNVEPGTVVGVPVDTGVGVFGYRIESDLPVTVAWEITGDRGVALAAGIPSR